MLFAFCLIPFGFLQKPKGRRQIQKEDGEEGDEDNDEKEQEVGKQFSKELIINIFNILNPFKQLLLFKKLYLIKFEYIINHIFNIRIDSRSISFDLAKLLLNK